MCTADFALIWPVEFSDYSDDLWGITASDSVRGYVVWGGPPSTGPIDGTVVPCAAGGSLPFLQDPAMRVLHTMKDRYGNGAWCQYGFVDAFNPLTNWYDHDVIGIDTGITMVMAENARTGFVWDTFMKNPEAQRGMMRAGFQSSPALELQDRNPASYPSAFWTIRSKIGLVEFDQGQSLGRQINRKLAVLDCASFQAEGVSPHSEAPEFEPAWDKPVCPWPRRRAAGIRASNRDARSWRYGISP